ncbi:MAG: hypothetical protein K9N46_06785 [Candidatus Marinimicrobia bacterium]|nr:hypothetical protein [Candidatus Neomarinimicrobiota bacterium]MCF7828685.1 hypothetical protein [Candidatus Neomarinimicrobiota bacterium]MCF7880426.1 hypothetical protein [Candidatus Neomarinimicrobiota bacterium]
MKEEQLYDAMVELAERLDIEVVTGRGDFSGGYCRVREDRRIVLNKHSLLPTKLRVMARNLLQFDLSNMYILPAVREFLEMVLEEEGEQILPTEEAGAVEED